jgi:hypothetical protein
MSSWFGSKKKEKGKTILLLDIENGSVGSALVRLSPGEQPKLFGEYRSFLPIRMARSAHKLAEDVEHALVDSLRHASEVAARIRAHPKAGFLGQIEHVAAVLAPPWGRPDLAHGRPQFLDEMTGALARAAERTIGDVPVSHYTSAGVAAYGTRAIFAPEPCLSCIVTGEVSELLHMDEAGVRAHATIPLGSHSFLRTLQAHGGLSEQEARSAAKLPFGSPHIREASKAAAAAFSEQFKDAARELLRPGEVMRVRVLAAEPVGEWFARALSADPSLAELFPQGGEVRALRQHHLMPHLMGRTQNPDLMLSLGALFVDNRFNTIASRV